MATFLLNRVGGVAALLSLSAFLLSGCIATPEPLDPAEHAQSQALLRHQLAQESEPVHGPISLPEAIARALKYNMDHQLAVMEAALAENQLDLSRYDLLPRLAANAGFKTRSNEDAASSRSLATGLQTLQPSISTDEHGKTADLSMSWNVLDFGVSYIAAHQQADRSLAAQERRRKVIQNVVRDVRAAYWQAANLQHLHQLAAPVLADADAALRDSRRVEEQRLRAPIDALRYQKSVLEIMQALKGIDADLEIAKAQLASLINLAPDTPFTVVEPTGAEAAVPQIALPLAKLQSLALQNRPELREQAYQLRITDQEVTKTFLKFLPGLTLEGGPHYDSNSYLAHRDWAEGGVSLTWNLLKLVSLPAAMKADDAAQKVEQTRQVALTVAVMTQVNIAYRQYQRASQQFQQADQLNDLEQRIYRLVAAAQSADSSSVLERVRSGASAVATELARGRSLAELHAASGTIYASLGLDPIPSEVESVDLAPLTAEIAKINQEWESGHLPDPVPDSLSAVDMAMAEPVPAIAAGAAPIGSVPVAAPTPPPATAPVPITPPRTTPPPPPPTPAAAPAESGGLRVQISAERSDAAAHDEWERQRRLHPDLLAGLSLSIITSDLGARGTFHRVLAGPLPNEAKAKQLCSALEKLGTGCFLVR